MTLKDKLLVYTYRKMCEMESEKEMLNAMRYKGPYDSLDLYELMRQDVRIQCWEEFINELYKIIIGGSF